jgi:hypothetical protein
MENDPTEIGAVEAIEAIEGVGAADVNTENMSREEDEEEAGTTEEASSSMSDDGELGVVNHLYEIFTNAQGTNVTEALLGIRDSIDKTNKILYKILNTMAARPSP